MHLEMTVLDFGKLAGLWSPHRKAIGQDQARNMIRLVGGVSRTINASPPAGWWHLSVA